MGWFVSYYKDFWEYDPAANTWTQKADFGGTGASMVPSASPSGARATSGRDAMVHHTKRFLGVRPCRQYLDTEGRFRGDRARLCRRLLHREQGLHRDGIRYGYHITKTSGSTTLPPIPGHRRPISGGQRRDYAVGFSIGSKGYIGTGYDGFINTTKDFWEYDPAANTWTQRPISGGQREYCRRLLHREQGLHRGRDTIDSYTKDFWEYEPSGQTNYTAHLYFPHVDTSLPWQTEIAIINTSDQTVTGTLRALSDAGQLVDTKAVTLSAHGRKQITVAEEFTNHTNIGYIIFDTNSAAVQGYTKFYQAGKI